MLTALKVTMEGQELMVVKLVNKSPWNLFEQNKSVVWWALLYVENQHRIMNRFLYLSGILVEILVRWRVTWNACGCREGISNIQIYL